MIRHAGSAVAGAFAAFAAILPGALSGCGGGGSGGGGGAATATPSGALSTITVTPLDGLAADGVAQATIVVIVRDVDGHFMQGVDVTVSATGGGNVVTQPLLASNGLGAVSAYIKTSTAGAKTLTVTLDPNDMAVTCTSHPIVRFGPRARVSGGARLLDVNGNGQCDAGDQLAVGFDRPVAVGSTSAASFTLPVTGDTFGAGALVAAGPAQNEVTVTFGASPMLRSRQPFAGAQLTAGSPSGIDISGAIAAGAIVDVTSGQTAEASAPIDVIPSFVNAAASVLDRTTLWHATADLDADGDLDLVTLDDLGDPDVYTNDGAGVFTDSGQAFLSGGCAAIGDVDGDSDVDLVLGRALLDNLVYVNDGLGVFTATTESLGSYSTAAVALVDIDGDLDLDLIEGNFFEPIYVYRNDGSGHYTEDVTTLGTGGTFELAVGDLDGDGDQDFLAGGLYSDDQVWLNDSTGTFTATGVSFHAALTAAFALGDVDEDGDLDLAAAEAGEPLLIFLNDGSAAFSDSGQALGENNAAVLAFHDYDVDGDLDLLAGASTGLSIFDGDGAGVFTTLPVDHRGYSITTMAIGDYDHDGDDDVLSGCVTDTHQIRRNSLVGSFGPVSYSDSGQALGGSDSRALVSGDLDGDGQLDLIQGAYGAATVVWLGQGDGTFVAGGSFSSTETTALALGDLDGDLDLDVIVGEGPADDATVWLNDGSAGFTVTAQLFTVATHNSIVLGDLDGDLDLDVVFGDDSTPNEVWLNDGSGAFTNTAQALGVDATTALALGDLDGDGDLDLVEAVAGVGDEVVWLNDGSGVFTSPGSFAGGDARGIVLFDRDGDGDLDVAVGNNTAPDTVFDNDGSATFTPTAQSLGTYAITRIAAADVDHDLDLDLFAASTDGSGVHVYVNDGAGDFTEAASSYGAAVTFDVAISDLDGDGDLDFVTANGSPAAAMAVFLHD